MSQFTKWVAAWESGFKDVSIIRRVVSGTRILRQYDCITEKGYQIMAQTVPEEILK